MSGDSVPRGQLAFELHVAESTVTGMMFSPGPGSDGGLFSFSVGPLGDDALAALERAAQDQTPVRLMFSEHPLLLNLVSLERKEPHCARIVGHVLKAKTHR